MLLGVPVFATICMFISKGVERALRKRGLPEDTDSYMNAKDIDPETRILNPLPVGGTEMVHNEDKAGMKSSDEKRQENGADALRSLLSRHKNKKEDSSEDKESGR